jgi:hypothetical protein
MFPLYFGIADRLCFLLHLVWWMDSWYRWEILRVHMRALWTPTIGKVRTIPLENNGWRWQCAHLMLCNAWGSASMVFLESEHPCLESESISFFLSFFLEDCSKMSYLDSLFENWDHQLWFTTVISLYGCVVKEKLMLVPILCIWYVTDNPDLLADFKVGDVIQSIRVTIGLDNVVNPAYKAGAA